MWHIDRHWHVWYTPNLMQDPGAQAVSYYQGDYIAHSEPFRRYLAKHALRLGTPLDELEAWND